MRSGGLDGCTSDLERRALMTQIRDDDVETSFLICIDNYAQS